MKRILAAALLLCLILPAMSTLAETKIAITVDDCWYADNVKKIMEIADESGFKLTFFPIGRILGKTAWVWPEVVADGHEIGNHSYSHASFAKKNEEQIYSDLKKMQDTLNRALGYDYPIRYIRTPHGAVPKEPKTLAAVEQMGYEDSVYWDVSTRKLSSALAAVNDGKYIMLFHTNYQDVDALRIIIPALKEAGYISVTLSEFFGFVDEATDQMSVEGGDTSEAQAEAVVNP